MGKRHTPKAKQLRKAQLQRLGLDADKIADVLDYEFDLQMGRYPGIPMEGKRFKDGGTVKGYSKIARPQKFKGIF